MYKRLFFLREYNDLYQKDVSKIINVSQQTYSLYENGTRIIPLKHLNTLCNYYNVSMDYILSLSDNKDSKYDQIKTLNKNIIGERLKYVREKNNLTLRDLAKKLNTTSSTISAYETGKNLILTAFLYQICANYKVSADWLCGRSK